MVGLTAVGLGAVGQARLEAFPPGTTTMTFTVMTDELATPQTLELQVIVHPDGTYTVRMQVEATGTRDQLAGFGFLLGGATLAHGGGEDVSLAALQMLMDQRGRLQPGEEYLLPGGGTLTNVTFVDIAGVHSVQGVFVDPRTRDARTTVAFGVSHPVYSLPRVRVERWRGGAWVTVFWMELVAYAFVGR
jgi:hypothetical protein